MVLLAAQAGDSGVGRLFPESRRQRLHLSAVSGGAASRTPSRNADQAARIHVGNAADDGGKLHGIAQHAAPMQPAQLTRRIGIAGQPSVELGIHLAQKPAARPDGKGRDQADAENESQPAFRGKGDRPDDAGNDQRHEIGIEHAAQQPGDRRDVELHQQKGRRRQQEIPHRKQQDHGGEQGDGIRRHASTF